jgi:hypothetical protein
MKKAQLIHLLEQCPDDTVIMIAKDKYELIEAVEVSSLIVEEVKRRTFTGSKPYELEDTNVVYLTMD